MFKMEMIEQWFKFFMMKSNIYLLKSFTKYSLKNSCGDLNFPLNLEDLKNQVNNINMCYNDNKFSIHIIHMICFIFLQTWCIPGTLLFNLFGGAVFGLKLGFILCLLVSFIYYNLKFV